MSKWTAAALCALMGFAAPAIAADVTDGLHTTRPVGFVRVSVPDPKGPPIAVGIWYPTTASPAPARLALIVQQVAIDGPVNGDKLPLVIISHGTQGSLASHADTALALADAGYVAAAPLHTGDNFADQSGVGGPQWFADRSRHVAATIDYMLTQWSGHTHVDPARVGMFGFSAGGTTALIAIGGRMQFDRVAQHCAKVQEIACTLWKGGQAPDEPFTHDVRIKAAVIAAPGFGFAFVPNGLANVTVPVQLWGGEADENVPVAANVEPVRTALGSKVEFHLARGAAHMSFVVPCNVDVEICVDPKGFDRKAFHAQFNAALVSFFDAKLKRP